MFFRMYNFQSNILSKAHPEALRSILKNNAFFATSRGNPISPLLVLYYDFHLLGLLSLKQFLESHFLIPTIYVHSEFPEIVLTMHSHASSQAQVACACYSPLLLHETLSTVHFT